MYIVIEPFSDGGVYYEAGDKYPRPGHDVTNKRLFELENRLVIVDVDAPCAECAIGGEEQPAQAAVGNE